jgi:hypothetical protein
MAQRKEDLSHNKHQAAPTTKRSRITIDLSPELRRRIKLAALQHDLSISEYISDILEQTVPEEKSSLERERRPVTRDFLESVYRVRERIMQESKGQLFEDSAELIRQQREKRTQQLMGEL